MDKIIQTQQLIGEINRMHREFSNAYFETGRMEKINLSRTIGNVPASHIYQYRLTLHECVNDYLMTANIEMKYFYRVKTRESIDDKIQRYSTSNIHHHEQFKRSFLPLSRLTNTI